MFLFDSKPKSIARILTCAGIFFITLCLFLSSSSVMAAGQKAAVQTTAADRSGAAHAVVDVDPVGGPRAAQVNLQGQATSNFIVRSFGDHFYMIGRYKTDNLTKYHIDKPTEIIYQESVAEEGSPTTNPHDLIFVGSEKAYMPMYGSTKCWIINPQTGKQIGELDLSAYADPNGDGYPKMHLGVIVDNKLFLMLKRLNGYNPEINSYVAVFDITTDQEIDTTAGAAQVNADGLKGIDLGVRNANSIQYLPENNTIYIAATGKYPNLGRPDLEYTGGVVTINPDTYETKILIDDGPDGADGDHPLGAFTTVMAVSPTQAYLFTYKGSDDQYVFPFNPTTGVVSSALPDFCGVSIDTMDSSTPLDENGMLWLGIGRTVSKVYILNPTNNSIDEKVDVSLCPETIAFCPQTIWPGSNAVQSATGTGTIEYSFNMGSMEYFKAFKDSEFDDASNPADGVDTVFRDGLISFQVGELGTAATVTTVANNGSSLEATIKFPSKRKAEDTYYVVDSNGKYVALSTDNIKTVDDYTITLTLTDGDEFDKDGAADGKITHVGGFAGEPDADPDTGGGDSGGGGCFIGNTH